jgi:hypothetical protein
MTNPNDGTTYQYAELLGCVARKSDGYVTQAECAGVGGTWKTPAETKAQCDGHGDICIAKHNDWEKYGGFTERSTCEQCDLRYKKKATWIAGKWNAAVPRPLSWVTRKYDSINSWDSQAFDSQKFSNLIKNSIARIFAESYESQILCNVAPYETTISSVAHRCGAIGAVPPTSSSAVISYDLLSKDVPCSQVSSMEMEVAAGKITAGSSSSCASQGNFMTATMSKQQPILDTGTARRGTVCAAYAHIRKAGTLVGQTMGAGIGVGGVNNVNLCMSVTVTNAQICPEYNTSGVVELSNGGYGEPLAGITITVNAQGAYCFNGAQSGKTYVPVRLLPNWESFTAAPTATPIQSGTPAPTQPDLELTQAVTVTSLSVADYQGATKRVYEIAYGISLGIYDQANAQYFQGNTVSSTAVANTRRAGVVVTYTAVIEPSRQSTAQTAATAIRSNSATLLNNFAAAKTAVGATANAVVIPTASDVSVAEATTRPLTSPPASSSSDGSALVIIIIIVAGVVVALLVAAAIAYFFCCQKDAKAAAESNPDKGGIGVEMAPGGTSTSASADGTAAGNVHVDAEPQASTPAPTAAPEEPTAA